MLLALDQRKDLRPIRETWLHRGLPLAAAPPVWASSPPIVSESEGAYPWNRHSPHRSGNWDQTVSECRSSTAGRIHMDSEQSASSRRFRIEQHWGRRSAVAAV